MKEEILKIISDLLDDHNVALYALLLLAILTPDLRELIAGGILGYWTKSIKENK